MFWKYVWDENTRILTIMFIGERKCKLCAIFLKGILQALKLQQEWINVFIITHDYDKSVLMDTSKHSIIYFPIFKSVNLIVRKMTNTEIYVLP